MATTIRISRKRPVRKSRRNRSRRGSRRRGGFSLKFWKKPTPEQTQRKQQKRAQREDTIRRVDALLDYERTHGLRFAPVFGSVKPR